MHQCFDRFESRHSRHASHCFHYESDGFFAFGSQMGHKAFLKKMKFYQSGCGIFPFPGLDLYVNRQYICCVR